MDEFRTILRARQFRSGNAVDIEHLAAAAKAKIKVG